MSISENFKMFCSNLRMNSEDISKVQYRYHMITKRINMEYWSSISDINNHSLYVGSYGRGTDIFVSDIDMLVELPAEVYHRFNRYSGNKQSAFLQEVKEKLQKTYSSSHLKGDGQIISIKFSDGINFEILPCFLNQDRKTYTHADSNCGGSWKVTNPKSEIQVVNELNLVTNKNYKRLCRMMRAWKYQCNVNISGILIDTLVFKFLKEWEYKDKSYVYYDWMSREFFKYLKELDKLQTKWFVPGSNRYILEINNFTYKALQAYNKSLEAIEAESNSNLLTAKSKWREIYGTKFPS